MAGLLAGLSEAARWRLLVDAAKQAAGKAGYKLTRVPGRGLSNIWSMEKGGKTQMAAIRTTRDRWIAFPPLNGGTEWKTLDDVKLVVVAAVELEREPTKDRSLYFSCGRCAQAIQGSLCGSHRSAPCGERQFWHVGGAGSRRAGASCQRRVGDHRSLQASGSVFDRGAPIGQSQSTAAWRR